MFNTYIRCFVTYPQAAQTQYLTADSYGKFPLVLNKLK